jgi:hypothetical protein
VAFVEIFKTQQNGSFFVLSTDLLIVDARCQYQNANQQAEFFGMDETTTFDYNNYTTVRMIYSYFTTGLSDVVFNLTVRVYQRTLIALIPEEQVTIPLNTTLYMSP